MRIDWNNKERLGMQRLVLRLMKILIIVLSIALVLGIVTAINNFTDVTDTGFDAELMEYYIAEGNYERLIEAYHTNVAQEVRAGEAMEECCGVARYYEAAFYYKAYLETGDEQRAQREKQKMNDAYEAMGSWNIVAEDIRSEIGLAD